MRINEIVWLIGESEYLEDTLASLLSVGAPHCDINAIRGVLEPVACAVGACDVVDWRSVAANLLAEIVPETAEPKTNPTPQPTPQGVNSMAKPFETRHYVFGKDVALMSEDELIQAINQVNSQIESLSKVDAKSAVIDKRVNDLREMKALIVATLDGEAAPAPKASAKASK